MSADAPPEPGPTSGLRLDHVAMMVPELESGLAWYEDKFGATLLDRWLNAENGMEWAHLKVGDFTLELVRFPELETVAGRRTGYHHLGVTVADCDAEVARLQAKGVEVLVPPADFDRHGIRWSFVRDSYGNVIEIISKNPAASESSG